MVLWRKDWADTVNQALESAGLDERIDHRSHAERGLDEHPTITEGVAARAIEAKGFVSDRCELNRQIQADNALIRELKALIAKLKAAARMTLSELAAALENIRGNIIALRYGQLQNRHTRQKAQEYLSKLKSVYGQFVSKHRELKASTAKLRALQKELAGCSVLTN